MGFLFGYMYSNRIKGRVIGFEKVLIGFGKGLGGLWGPIREQREGGRQGGGSEREGVRQGGGSGTVGKRERERERERIQTIPKKLRSLYINMLLLTPDPPRLAAVCYVLIYKYL